MKEVWKDLYVKDIVKLNYGKGLPKSERNPDGAYPVYGANGIMDWSDKVLATGPSIVIGRKGSAGELKVAKGPFWPSDVTYFTTHDPSAVDFEYLYYLLQYLNLPSLAKGVKPGINRNDVYSLKIPIPPLDEQKRIVSILDQAFEGLDRARANAEANLESVEELIKSTFEQELRGLDEAQECALSDHIELLTGFAFKSSGYVDDPDGMRLIRGDNVIPGEMRWDGAKKWPRSDTHNYVKYHLQAGDLLIAMDRTWIKSGIKYAVLTEADVPSMLVQRVARLRPKQSLQLGFLELTIGSRHFEQYVLSIQTGSGVPHVSGDQIKQYRLKIPSISAQTRISEKFAKLNADKLSLQLAYRHTLNQADELRQSILQKAFSGELT